MRESWGRPTAMIGLALAGLALIGLILTLTVFEPWAGPTSGAAGDETATGSGSPAQTVSPQPVRPSPSASPSASPSPTRSATTPPRPTGGKPGPANTGVPAGVSLRVVTGDQVYTRDNQVISGLDIRGYVRIRAQNVTIRNSIVRGGAQRCNAAVIFVEGGRSAKIEDTEIDPTNPNACLDGIWATNATLTRLDIHDVVDGVKAFDNVTVTDSYIHDLSWFANDPNQGGGATHNDAVQTYEGNRNIVLRHNNLDLTDRENAALQVTQDGGGTATNLRIEYNWLNGGGCTLNFAHKGGPTPMTGIYVIGNRFGRDSHFDCPILISTETVLTRCRETCGTTPADRSPAPSSTTDEAGLDLDRSWSLFRHTTVEIRIGPMAGRAKRLGLLAIRVSTSVAERVPVSLRSWRRRSGSMARPRLRISSRPTLRARSAARRRLSGKGSSSTTSKHRANGVTTATSANT